MDPSAEKDRLVSSNYLSFGAPDQPSYLASANRTCGNLRQTACTRPTPSPAFDPPERLSTPAQVAAFVAEHVVCSFDHGMMYLSGLPFLDEAPPLVLLRATRGSSSVACR